MRSPTHPTLQVGTMIVDLPSEDLQFELTLPTGKWAVRTNQKKAPFFEGAGFGASWRQGTSRRSWIGDMRDADLTESAVNEAPESPNRSLLIELREFHGVGMVLEICLGLDVPALFWRMRVENRSGEPIRLDRLDMFRLGYPAGATDANSIVSRLHLQSGRPDLAFFSNGWESWNVTGVLGRSDRFPRTRLGPLVLPMSRGAVKGQPRGRGRFTSEMFGVLGDRAGRIGLLLGFLSQLEAFGGLRVDLAHPGPRIHVWADCDGAVLDPGGRFSTDWCGLEFIELDDEDPLGSYVDRVARANLARIGAKTPAGWCSWYQFYQAVTVDDVYANLAWAEVHRPQIPLDVIQLDDGFASEVGDWYTTNGDFPSGLPAVSRNIREAGCVPGLWLAPFVAKPGARITKEHPDWILRNRLGAPANAGFIWDRFTRALDVTHPQVIGHVENLISTAVHEWGFEYLKLDFLYAGALRGIRYDPHRTRAQALCSILERIRSAAGEGTILVGCGCPLGPGIGIFDAMRIGPDVAARWEPAYRAIHRFLRAEPDLPSARNAVHNAITRAPFNRRWWVNDPDCLILRGDLPASANESHEGVSADRTRERKSAHNGVSRNPSRLTWDETKTLATIIALSGGSLLISDHLPDLPAERLDWLARFLPPLPSGFRAIDWFDEKHPRKLVLPLRGAAGEWFLVGLVNWAAEPADVSIDLKSLKTGTRFAHAVDFWNGDYVSLDGGYLDAREIPPHGVRLFGIRAAAGPQWLGDTLHVSQGLAVSDMKVRQKEIRVELDLGRRAAGRVWLELPAPPLRITMEGDPIAVVQINGQVYACDLDFDVGGRLEVGW